MKRRTGRSWVAHRGSHRDLLRPPDFGGTAVLDAIVVPATRPAEFLRPAMRLATAVGCRFIALCSGSAKAQDVVRLARKVPGLRYAVVPVPRGYRHELLTFSTSSLPGAGVRRLGDLSTKRNLGLLVGHLAGWRAILFLDDDIRRLEPAVVRRAVSALRPGGAVGMPACQFPDNSVVCHANRLAPGGGRERQDVFVSGSALVVDCGRIDSFFPRVYNEDWLFLVDAVARRAVSAVGSSVQLEYKPFETPERAAAEEFGDVLAEGLMSLLQAGHPEAEWRAEFWDEFLIRRKEFILDITRRVGDSPGMIRALEAAEGRRAEISGMDLADYVARWRADQACWRERLGSLPRGLPSTAILRRLQLPGAALSPSFDAVADSTVWNRWNARLAAEQDRDEPGTVAPVRVGPLRRMVARRGGTELVPA